MIDLELSELSKHIVEKLAETEPDEEVLVLTDAELISVARAIASGARAVGASTMLTVMPRTEAHGNEPPATVTEAMKASDATFTVTTHSITHTRARNAASDAGTRVVVMRGVTEEMMIEGGMNVDLNDLRDATESVRDTLEAAGEVHVTNPSGTDVTFDISDRPAFSLDGFFHGYGFSALPAGESPTSPTEGSTEGTVVIDYSMDNIGVLNDPIKITFEEGHVTAIQGDTEANRLQTIVTEADDNAGNMAEFAIGTNPNARLIGNLAEDKKKRGTVHFAIGDNASLGGAIESNIHLDGVVLEPTVQLDDTIVVEDGTLLLDQIREFGSA